MKSLSRIDGAQEDLLMGPLAPKVDVMDRSELV